MGQNIFDRRRSPNKLRHCENTSDLCSCVGGLWLTTTGIWVSDSTAVISSDPPELYYVLGNTLGKRSASYCIHTGEHLIKYFIFIGKLHCCNSTFTYVLFKQLL